MYLNISKYRKYVRVRILEKVMIGGKRVTRLVEHVGSARNETELAVLRIAAEKRLIQLRPQFSLLDRLEQHLHDPARLSITNSYAYGLWSIVGNLYDKLGLPDNLLKYLVLARIALPKSKLSTVRYLEGSLNRTVDVQSIYDFMDTLRKDLIMPCLLDYAQKQTDCDTTKETGLRKKGYSKDHRFDLPQVVIGLTVDGYGFPLDFQVYEGNTYEGSTLIDGIRSIQTALSIRTRDLTVIADAGMLSQTNIDTLEKSDYSYIVGARIKSLNKTRTEELLNRDYIKQGVLDVVLETQFNRRLIVTYSEKRAKRSKQNRDQLVKKLQSRLDHGKIIKKSKYILLNTVDNASATVKSAKAASFTGSIDQAKIDQDGRFDVLKGYVTNTTLTTPDIVARYTNLWTVEKSFRMSKSDLRSRPVFHFKRRRIIAHLLICVCSLAVLRKLEQKIAPLKPTVGLSIAIEQLLAIRQYTLHIPNQPAVEVYSHLTPIQEQLMRLEN